MQIPAKKNMNTAFVHCRILPGGALEVLSNLIKDEQGISENFCIFTITSDRTTWEIPGVGKIKVVTALPKWVNKVFNYFSFHHVLVLSFFCDYRNLMVFYPLLMKILSYKIRKYAPQKIVISSFAVAKNLDMCKRLPRKKIGTSINSSKGPTIKLYLHCPMQYIWSHYDEYLTKLSGFKLRVFRKISNRLRNRDKNYCHYDEVIANSKYTANLAKEIYDIDAEVSYPKVNEGFFDQQINIHPSSYYLYVGRLTNFVRETDTIIHLFNNVKQPLLIMGSGPDEAALKKLAGDTIIFLGWIQDPQEKINIIKNAKGIINLTKESFGIGTVEALLLGVPVFGLADGATPELVDEKSGILVKREDFDTLAEKFLEFSEKDWDREIIAQHIQEKLLKQTEANK